MAAESRLPVAYPGLNVHLTVQQKMQRTCHIIIQYEHADKQVLNLDFYRVRNVLDAPL